MSPEWIVLIAAMTGGATVVVILCLNASHQHQSRNKGQDQQ